jgi:hypothetical protein
MHLFLPKTIGTIDNWGHQSRIETQPNGERLILTYAFFYQRQLWDINRRIETKPNGESLIVDSEALIFFK